MSYRRFSGAEQIANKHSEWRYDHRWEWKTATFGKSLIASEAA
jgi:hypothetical protein